MKYPDFNIGYVFGYNSAIIIEGFLITFLGGIVRIRFRFKDIEKISEETYNGGRISWDVIGWGKCPHGKEALRVVLKKGQFMNHLIVFDNIENAVETLKKEGWHFADF